MMIRRSVGVESGGSTVPAPGDVIIGLAAAGPPACGLTARITGVRPGVAVVGLIGDVDLASEQVLADALYGAVSATAGGRVVVDLNRLGFLGACGLALLLAAHEEARRHGGGLALVVDDVTPAAVSLRFLPPGGGPAVYSSLTAALSARENS